MKKYKLFTKNFTPLFKGAKAELIALKGTDGGPQAVAQFYDVELAKKIEVILNAMK